MKTILVTGGCGFIGHHLVQHIMVNTDYNIIIIDKLTYASCGYNRIREMGYLNNNRIKIYTHDLATPISVGLSKELGDINYIAHLAAETHVDNSIKEPILFISNNVMSTAHILEYSRTLKTLEKFIYFSTDEVYGPALGDIAYSEMDRHNPKNPYSASKSAAEQICISYENTYKLPIITMNVMNVIGERQLCEKFIPLVIKKILDEENIEIHTDKMGVPGTRFYIHARNVADAVLFILNNGSIGECYHVVGEKEVNNYELVESISKLIGKDFKHTMVDFHSNRPGHDLRYGLNGDKLKKLGWMPPNTFDKSLEKTILWTLNNKQWLTI